MTDNIFGGVEIIDAGIGTIQYQTDNLQLELLMESLAEKIQQYGPAGTLKFLESKTGVLE